MTGPGQDTTVEFWFEFASTYSYPTAMRIRDVARRAGVQVQWRAFLLGPIFRDLGWRDSPFNLQPAKGRYMWLDLARACEDAGIPLQRPSVFPRNGLHAARIAAIYHEEEWLPEFVERVYTANFAEDRDISEDTTIADCLRNVGADADEILDRSRSDAGKAALRDQTTRAVELGIFGAPSFIVGEELFWGNDRLERAIQSARRDRPADLRTVTSPPAATAAIEQGTRSLGFDMASDRATGSLLRALAASKPDGLFLEIGTGTGLATAWIADGMTPGARLETIDSDPSVVDLARRNLGADSRIEFSIADAEQLLESATGTYDLIFADAWPGKFDLTDRALDLLAPGGFYVIDDLLPQPNWPPGHGENVRRLLEHLETRSDLAIARLDWSTGIVVATRRS